MESLFRRLATSLLVVLTGGIAAACGSEPAAPSVGSTQAPLLEGRTIPLEVIDPLTGRTERLDVPAENGDVNYDALVAYVSSWCSTVVTTDRFGKYYVAVPDADDELIAQNLRDQGRRICAGYAFLDMAESLAPIDIIDTGTAVTLAPRRVGADPATDVKMTIPVLAGSDGATAALIASRWFQEAALDGRRIMQNPELEPAALQGTIPSAGDERVTVAFVLMSQTNEAVDMMRDAARVASRLISAAAQERLSLDPDPVRARIRSWRGMHDSRLEIANLWIGAPVDIFEPEPSRIADGPDGGAPAMAPLVSAEGLYPVVTWVPTRASEQRAVEVLRAARIDPRPVGTTSAGDRLRQALQADHPEQFPLTTSTEEFLEQIGIDEHDLANAANMLVQEAQVLGNTIVRDSEVEPIRVTGTEGRTGQADPTYAFAQSGGKLTINDGGDDGSDIIPEDSEEFCGRSVVGTALCVHGATEEFLDNTTPHVSLPAITIGEAGASGTHDEVPRVAHVCVGAEQANGGSALVRLRLYGIEGTGDAEYWSSRIQLWWGEEGRTCAVRSPSETACVRHRIGVTPTILTIGRYRVLQWSVTADKLPAAAAAAVAAAEGEIPATGVIYVTERDAPAAGLARRGVTGFALRTGTSAASFSRCTFLPIGPAVDEAATYLVADAELASEPAASCAGLDGPLPLEDVFTESGVSGDFMEAAFLHYLDRAETAAARAEHLGERLIAEQMEMNQMAEGSIQRVNQICGTTLSAGRVSVTPPEACTAGSTCLNGAPCESGRCRASALDLVNTSDPADMARLRRCLGDDEAPTPVNLGERPLCAWMLNGEVCGCPAGQEATCARCPAYALESGTTAEERCAGAFNADAGLGRVVPINISEYVLTRPLGIIQRDGARIPTPLSACYDLAWLRRSSSSAGRSLPDLMTAVMSAPWFTMPTAQAVARSLRVREDLGGFIDVQLGGQPWISTGTLDEGPLPTPTACQFDTRAPSIDVSNLCGGSDDRPLGQSIRCRWGDCSSDYARALTNGRLQDALLALELISGVEIDSTRGVPMTGTSGAPHNINPLPSWLGASGMITTQRHQESPTADPVYSYCVSASAGLNPLYWPPCSDSVWPPIAFPRAVSFWSEHYPVLQYRGDRAATAVHFWQPQATRFDFCDDLYTCGGRLGGGRGSESYGQYTLAGLLSATVRHQQPAVDHFGAFVRQDFYRDGGGVAETRLVHNVSHEAAFDALEMICAATEESGGHSGCPAELDELPDITSVEDIDRLEMHVECVADRFESVAEQLIFLEMTPLVADDIEAARITGTFPSYSGQYGESVAELRRQMEGVVGATRQFASVIRDVAGDLRIARSQERTADAEAQLRQLELLSQMSSHLSRCLAAATPSVSASGPSWNAGSIFVCGDAILQMVVAVEMNSLSSDIDAEHLLQARTQTSLQFSSRMDQMANATQLLSESFAGINGTFSRMQAMRHEARRELAHSLFMDRDDVGQEWTLGRGMRGRHNRTRAQYTEAQRSAVQLAHLARRAIEQRIGFDLGEMRSAMTLVEAPSTWADTVCTTTGIDFYDVWSATPEWLPRGIQTTADYVHRLRMFLDSYMLDYPFENSTDVTVLSLRDDFLRDVRMSCDLEGPNLLLSSEAFEMGSRHWQEVCAPHEGELCSSINRTSRGAFVVGRELEAVTGVSTRGRRALGGGGEARVTLTCPLVDGMPVCGGPTGTGGGWGQVVDLAAGDYLLSWYERVAPPDATPTPVPPDGSGCVTGTPMHAPLANVQLLGAVAGVANPTAVAEAYLPVGIDRWIDACRWRRVAAHVSIDAAADGVQPYRVIVRIDDLQRAQVSASADEATYAVGIAGVQLERVSPGAQLDPLQSDFALAPYFPTDEEGTWPVGPCEDRDARDLRSRFRYTCEAALCPSGIGTACTADASFDPDLRTCYWETDIQIALGDIESGRTIPNGGFAVGNFNYRVDSLAVNLVGTSVRDCSRVGHGREGCYASGYIPFSLHHADGADIRNHVGDEFPMSIFAGAIVSAKALASERYLTNPMASADRALLTDYWRGEFRGRPVNGSYVLRIHDVSGLDFSRIEDVQIALGYRYWTRQQP